MGWLIGWNSKKELINKLTRNFEGENYTNVCLNYCVRGICLWQVRKRVKSDLEGSVIETKKYITLDLIKEFEGNEYGYKDMDESCDPFYYSCPLKYLKMAPEVVCQEWRDKVVAYHNRLNFKFEPGMIMELNHHLFPAVKVINKSTVETRDGQLVNFPRKLWTGNILPAWPEVV